MDGGKSSTQRDLDAIVEIDRYIERSVKALKVVSLSGYKRIRQQRDGHVANLEKGKKK